ncbi:exodeoxyribonuclease V subunit beta [Marinobacter sp. SS8-8]|uniref:UvrD-helicase domain-containing protein n=1 Tax=Marinobacter sp. SS8-8 TaxID=3050452 RepID=UPI0026DEC156|nr:UvrD-helicase domain-containing protein [Marinobacter sp. SS8-8]
MSQSAILPAQPLTLIKAGAGAGKTYTIQSTLADWIKQGIVKADRVLAVTFTNDAANEMRTRIRLALLKEGMMAEARLLQKSNISTIHAFGLEILKTFAYEAGRSPAPRQLTEQEQDFLLRKAMDQARAIQPVLDELEHYGYGGGFKGDDFQDADEQLTETILALINKLRSLGKGFSETADEAEALLRRAKDIITTTYGHVQKNGAPYADQLWSAIEAVRTEYPDPTTLREKGEWGNNGDTRAFVDNIYSATRERLDRDWKLWASLQFDDKLKKIREKHPRADLAEPVWNAAGKLSVHPGPLNDALTHIECLINGVLETLAAYQHTKEQAGLVDYGDMVHLANDMLGANPEWLDEIAGDYDCLIIDEFQDTNPLQYALLRRFQASSKYTLIVGDLKQSIMGFQGSDSRLFAELLNDGEKTPGVVKELDSNWRSTPELMDFINGVGAALFGSKYQELDPKAGYKSDLPAVQVLRFSKDHWNLNASAKSSKPGFTAEGNIALANHLKEVLASGSQITDRHTGEKRPIRGSDIAVLARGHSRLGKFAKALRSVGLEVQIQQPGFLACESVQWVLNALQALNNLRDHYAWLDLLTSPLMGGQSTERLSELLASYDPKTALKHNLKDLLEPLGNSLRKRPVKNQLLAIMEEARLFETLNSHPQGLQYRANLIKLIGLAEEFEALQPETLNAMGIAGKNASTFPVWLNENKDSIDDQPTADPQAEDAVVLKTWHSSKGLEWPVVMVLDAEKASEPRFPSISMAYPDGGIDTMLRDSFVKILPKFGDKSIEEQFAKLIAEEQDDIDRNLYYVALSRAREQLILPCWEVINKGCMLSYIGPLIASRNEKQKSAIFEELKVAPSSVERASDFSQPSQKIVLNTEADRKANTLKHTVSPSLDNQAHPVEVPKIKTVRYRPALELDGFAHIPANDLGVWVHRLYQVFFMRPEMLEKALALRPGRIEGRSARQDVKDHLDAFRNQIEKLIGKGKTWKCEFPALALNELGQVVSGMMDLIAVGEMRTLVIDHKSNQFVSENNYWSQLAAYQIFWEGADLNLNWVRHGLLEFRIS